MPRQFDVYRTASGTLVIVLQSDLLEPMRTRVVVPLLPVGTAGRPMRQLNPDIVLGEETFVLMPQLLATLTIAELRQHIGSIGHLREKITRAVNMLLSGL